MNFKKLERNRAIITLYKNGWQIYRIRRFFELYGESMTYKSVQNIINSYKNLSVKHQKLMNEAATDWDMIDYETKREKDNKAIEEIEKVSIGLNFQEE